MSYPARAEGLVNLVIPKMQLTPFKGSSRCFLSPSDSAEVVIGLVNNKLSNDKPQHYLDG